MNWNENQLSLGKPRCMDTPTLIEWIQRQLETEAETHARHVELGLNDEVVEVFVHGQSEPIARYKNGGMVYIHPGLVSQTEANDIKTRQERYVESRSDWIKYSCVSFITVVMFLVNALGYSNF